MVYRDWKDGQITSYYPLYMLAKRQVYYQTMQIVHHRSLEHVIRGFWIFIFGLLKNAPSVDIQRDYIYDDDLFYSRTQPHVILSLALLILRAEAASSAVRDEETEIAGICQGETTRAKKAQNPHFVRDLYFFHKINNGNEPAHTLGLMFSLQLILKQYGPVPQ